MKKFKAILVENDEDELTFMEQGFKSSGLFDVLATAGNGDELMEIISDPKKSLPEVIISDLNMHGKNGIDIIKEVLSSPALSHIKVIIISTSSSGSFIKRSMEAGAYSYFVKPETFNLYDRFAKDIYEKLVNE